MRCRLCLTVLLTALACPFLPAWGCQSPDAVPSPQPGLGGTYPGVSSVPSPGGELASPPVPAGTSLKYGNGDQVPGVPMGAGPSYSQDPFGASPTPNAIPSLLGTANSLDRFFQEASVRFIAFDEIDAERRKSITEDAAVLQHMLTKMLSRPNPTALGVNVLSHGEPNVWYVEDRGLLLFYTVDRPVAPAEQESKQPVEEPAVANAWERARQELQREQQRHTPGGYSLMASGINRGGGLAGGGYGSYPAGGPPAFDPLYVEELNKVVTDALAQIGNFRALAPNDTVTVFVRGPSADPTAGTTSVYAWRANPADAADDKTIPASAITRRQFSERQSSQPALPTGAWSR